MKTLLFSAGLIIGLYLVAIHPKSAFSQMGTSKGWETLEFKDTKYFLRLSFFRILKYG